MLILRRSNCTSTASGIVTLFRLMFSTQVSIQLILFNDVLLNIAFPSLSTGARGGAVG